MTAPTQDQLIARRVGAVELGLNAHHDYPQRLGTPTSVEELRGHAVIGFDEETPYLRTARRAFPIWSRDAFAVRSDSDLAQLAMIRAGAGIGICQATLAKRDSKLTRVMSRQMSLKLETRLTMHEDLRQSPRCKVLLIRCCGACRTI
jgi:DNA-binding transcriptional LysR family regulator